MSGAKIFTYEEAQELIETLQERTAFVHARVDALRAQLRKYPHGSPKAAKLNEWVNTAITQWADEVIALGALPKGLWTVDFDSGEGYYYCWTLNEEELAYFHLYEEGFAGRRPLTELHKHASPPLLV
ncbi:MAG: DUF2203 family protein [Candidatus Lambdaproteobacteria bacterium]|nr:DUF2203 family protein [Candidatus Lambdaproteobacteria bacterium]